MLNRKPITTKLELFKIMFEYTKNNSLDLFFSKYEPSIELVDKFLWDKMNDKQRCDVIFFYNLPINFIRKHKDTLDWMQITNYQESRFWLFNKHGRKSLNYGFIDEFKDYIDWNIIPKYYSYIENKIEFTEKYKDYIDWRIHTLELLQYLFEDDDLVKKFDKYIDWEVLSNNCEYLNFKFIRKYKDKLNWTMLTENMVVAEDILIEFKDYIDWDNLIPIHKLLSLTFDSKKIIDKCHDTIMTKSKDPIKIISYLIKYDEYLKKLDLDFIRYAHSGYVYESLKYAPPLPNYIEYKYTDDF